MADSWQGRLGRSTPFYYGWVVFALSALTSYSSRPLMAVTTLSVFVIPMTAHFGCSRGLFSGAVSLGGLCAVAISPLVGKWIDRYGSGALLAAASAIVGGCGIGLAFTHQVWAFYLLYVPGRMVFASPLELGTSTAVSNWFIRRRPLALALMGATQGTGLAAMPLVAQAIIGGWDWRVAWASLGIFTISVGVIPVLLFMVRRPEDIGLEADPGRENTTQPGSVPSESSPRTGAAAEEAEFTLRQAMATRTFWLLAAFSAAGFMVQGGVALHQVPHYIDQGVPASLAALAATTFALAQVAGGALWSTLSLWVPVRLLLGMAGITVGLAAAGAAFSDSLGQGLAVAAVFGVGVGGLHLLLRLTWADYYGRRHLGSIRGVTLSFQLGGQALGPVLAGSIFDVTGSYRIAFVAMAALALAAAIVVLGGTPPKKQPAQ